MERLQVGGAVNDFTTEEKRITSLVRRGESEEAIAECNILLNKLPDSKDEILRLRAYAFARQGRYSEAISDREAIIAEGKPQLRDFYQLGDNTLSAGRYAEASSWLRRVLALGKEHGEDWFKSGALLLLAYSEMKLGRLKDAQIALDDAIAVDPECAMPIRGEGTVTAHGLRAELLQRISKSL